MIKFLIITFLIIYLIFKFGGFLFRILFHTLGAKAQQKYAEQQTSYNRTKPKGSNVDVEYPKAHAQKSEFKGGEYVDFEEIK